jgi:toxin YhaV
LFLDQLEALLVEVEALRAKDLQGYVSKNASKRLAAIARLMLQDIPLDPSRKEYRQGSTLGPEHRHWHRAKFFQQYRLFFRFHNRSRVIVLGWVNDTDTKRAYGSKTDAYRVFQSMLANGHPPNDWEDLLQEASQASQRLQKLVSRAMDPNDDEP